MAKTAPHKAHLELIKEYYSKYRARITRGLSVYGEFCAATDKRVLSREATEEVLDVGSYMEMLEEKYPALQPKIQKIRAKAIILYGELLKLEQEEMNLSERA